MTSTSSNRPGAIIPANIGALRSLTVAMTVMCYLACLAIGALVLINRAVSSWTSGLSREVTVQVRQTKDADVEAEVAKAQEILQDFPGIAAVTVLDREAGAKLLEPWLGSRNLEDLPIPRLIRVAVDEAAPPDYEALGAALESVKGANLDTHRRWQSELTRMARALSVLAYTVLTLIAVSSVAIVVFGTRAVLQANRPIVDLLHLVGARDGYIARQIDGRFLKTGLFARASRHGPGTRHLLPSLAHRTARRRRTCRRQPQPALRATRVGEPQLRAAVRRAGDGDADQPGHLARHAHAHAG